MTNEEKCKHYDKENGWCKKPSDWSDPMPHIVYCPKSPCEYAEPIEQPMTDNDIIKALECCKGEGIPCADCPYIDFGQCQTYVATDALRLIDRLKTEIDILCNPLKVSNQNFENMARALITLKEKVYIPGAHPNYSDEIIIKIDNLVKEMTEGEDANV